MTMLISTAWEALALASLMIIVAIDITSLGGHRS